MKFTPAEARIMRRGRAAAKELQRRNMLARNWVPHEPWPKQKIFIDNDCHEALYGGAAGGGKSDALLMAAAKYFHVPRYSALIIRRTFKELSKPDSIMDRAIEWWRGRHGIHWDAQEKRFTFPSGAILTFGYFDTERDGDQYQSSAYQYIAVDELTEMPERWYRFLFSRLRRPEGMQVPLRMRGGTNPGGIGHEWVNLRFGCDGKRHPGEPGAVFMPALMKDNPSLDQDGYRASLAKLDETRRRQLEDGDWVQDTGILVYGRFNAARNVIDKAPELTHHVLGLDFGRRDRCAVSVMGWRDHDPCIYILQAYRLDALVSQMTDEAKALEQKYRFVKAVGDEGGMGKAFADEIRMRKSVPLEPAEKNNKNGYIALLNDDLARGRVKVLRSGCADLIDEWNKLPWDEKHVKEAEGFDNHAADATLYAWRATTAYHEAPIEPKPRGVEAIQAMADELERLACEPVDDNEWNPFSIG